MAEEIGFQNYGDRFFAELNVRIRDIEEKQRLLKDRMLLISDSFIKERDKNFEEIQTMKKSVEVLKDENRRIKDLLLRIGEKANDAPRKEDLGILQRQFDMFRKV